MKTNYGIPQEELDKVVARDTDCVYCHKKMIYPVDPNNYGDSATIEHLNYKEDWDSVSSYLREGKPVPEIIAICCGSCNSSRSNKALLDWFKTSYCQERNINKETVAEVVKQYIEKYEK
jgi:hypothetical protein